MNASSLLRRFIRRSNTTQAELARRLDVSKASVCLWLSGHIPGPLNALALERVSGGTVPAAAWSKKYADRLLTVSALPQPPDKVLNGGEGAISPRAKVRTARRGGDHE